MNSQIIDYTYLQNTTWYLKAQHPVLRVKNIGKSVVGRSIYALEIGRENAPAIIMAGTFWGTDDVTGRLLMQFAQRFLRAMDRNGTIDGVDPLVILRNRRIVLLPFVNPDGREICSRGAHCAGLDSGRIRRLSGGNTQNWNANARGVEIARNFDFHFQSRKKREHANGIYGAGSAGYSGPAPESEPETAAIAQYCRQQKAAFVLAFYPGSGEIYWRNRPNEPKKIEKAAHLLSLCAGYSCEANLGRLTDSGFRNWAAHTCGCPAMDVWVALDAANQPKRGSLEDMLIAACCLTV